MARIQATIRRARRRQRRAARAGQAYRQTGQWRDRQPQPRCRGCGCAKARGAWCTHCERPAPVMTVGGRSVQRILLEAMAWGRSTSLTFDAIACELRRAGWRLVAEPEPPRAPKKPRKKRQ